MTKPKPKFSVTERRNWGYWDGVNARKRGRYPEWAPSHTYRAKHPLDRAYGEAFWDGWEGNAHPNNPAIVPGSDAFVYHGGS